MPYKNLLIALLRMFALQTFQLAVLCCLITVCIAVIKMSNKRMKIKKKVVANNKFIGLLAVTNIAFTLRLSCNIYNFIAVNN